MTSTIKTIVHLQEWIVGASHLYEDAADPICLMFFRWMDRPEAYRGEDLVCGNLVAGEMDLWINPSESAALPVPVRFGEQVIDPTGVLVSFGVERIGPGVWAMTPSLNVAGLVHGFVVLYEVPEPAPFAIETVLSATNLIWTPGS